MKAVRPDSPPTPTRWWLLLAATAGAAGSLACVDTGPRKGAPGSGTGGQMATCEAAAPVPYSGVAAIPSAETTPPGVSPPPYAWKNVAIKGGGFVSGIIMSPALPGLVFARTDIGGAYRFDPTNRRWMAITDWVGHDDANLMGIESIATDPVDPNRVYMAAGTYLTAGNGSIVSSTDMGQTWVKNGIAAPMGGNVDGRSMGERLVVDPNLPSTLYFGSRNAGLWKSENNAQSWTQISSFPTNGATNGTAGTGYGLTFVLFDRASAAPGSATQTIYVGVGVTTASALYRSTDAGATWAEVPGQPSAMMPHHAVADGCGNLFFAYNSGPGPNAIPAGAVWRLDTASGTWTDVSPPRGAGGFGGIAADAAHPGTLIVTTMDRWSPDEIYRTVDGGANWRAIGASAGRDVMGATWLFWHRATPNATGWMGDVEIDPFNPARALYVTGQGIWSSDDVTAADSGAATNWKFEDDGLEETVALDLASPHDGPVLLSGVGDIAGFRHDDLAVSPPDGMFANPIFGNTTSLDFAGNAPAIAARVGTSSGGGQRGAWSADGGAHWTPFTGSPTGGTGSGSIAVSADGSTFVWAPQAGTPSYTTLDRGATWTASAGLTAGGGLRVSADRVNPLKFYASSRNRMYVSSDGGRTFAQVTSPAFGRPRPVFGIEGELWVPTSTGLLRSQNSGASFTPMPLVNSATAVGFGKAAPEQSYPAIYLAGSVGGVWGSYRSDDVGASWLRIDDPLHQFGFINHISGDPRQYGRVYLGTAGRGVVYGDPR